MPIEEVFSNPTVEKVIFQIRFANLFYLESKIGELQMRIMKEFPESSQAFRRQILIADLGDKVKLEPDMAETENDFMRKIWQFQSEKGYKLNVQTESLDITSEIHKTYNNPKGEHRFREIIKMVVDNFLNLTNLPIIKRIGLRYIDKCPVDAEIIATFRNWYNTCFPIDRFPISEANEMSYVTVIPKGKHSLRYAESFRHSPDGKYTFSLDFDGFSTDLSSNNYLEILDEIHDIISNEYEQSIKEPLYHYMREGGQ